MNEQSPWQFETIWPGTGVRHRRERGTFGAPGAGGRVEYAPIMMSKPAGRNDPCPCGSGKKYKRCCLEKDQAERVALQRAHASVQQEQRKAVVEAFDDAQALDAASNAVVDLVHAGKLDEAEAAARELLARYPEVPDGYDRLGMVYEARGDQQQATECYRKVIEFVRTHPGQFDPQYEQYFLAKLDSAATN